MAGHSFQFENLTLIDESANWALCGGNKIRKLSYILKGGRHKGLLSFGSPYSSHCIAVAYWGATHSIPVKLIVIADGDLNIKNYPSMSLSHSLGAELIQASPENARDEISKIKSEFSSYTWISGGGHEQAGVTAYRDWFSKLLEHDESLDDADTIVLPFGTGTTTLGIAQAIHELNIEKRIIGVSVSRDKSTCIKHCSGFVDRKVMELVTIDDRYSGKYAEVDFIHSEIQQAWFKTKGILVDPIYNIRVLQFLWEESIDSAIVVNTGGQWNNALWRG